MSDIRPRMKFPKFLPVLLFCVFFSESPVFTVSQETRKAELVVATGHPTGVAIVTFSPDGKLLASSGARGSVKLWDVETGLEVRTFTHSPDGLFSVAFSPDGRSLATAGYAIKTWDVRSGIEVLSLPIGMSPIKSIAYTPDGNQLVSLDSLPETVLKVWSLTEGRVVQQFGQPKELITAFALTHDGLRILSAAIGVVKVWNLRSGKLERTLDTRPTHVLSLVVSVDGKTLISGNLDGTITMWAIMTGKPLRVMSGHSGPVIALDVAANGSSLASTSGTMSSSGGLGGEVKLWDLPNGREIASFQKHEDFPSSVGFSPDGEKLASGNLTNSIEILDAKTMKEFLTLGSAVETVNYSLFSPNGRLLATSGNYFELPDSSSSVRLWDLRRGQPNIVRAGLPGSRYAIAFSPDGDFIASAGDDMVVRLWNTVTGELSWESRFTFLFTSVAFARDGKYLVAGSSSEIKVLDKETGREVHSLVGIVGVLVAVAISPDGSTLATATWKPDGFTWEPQRTKITLWDVSAKRELRTLDGPVDFYQSIDFARDGKTVIGCAGNGLIASEDHDKIRDIRVWDLETGKIVKSYSFTEPNEAKVLLQELPEPFSYCKTSAFTPDGKFRLSRGVDGVLDLFDTIARVPLANLVSLKKNDWLVTTPSGYFDGSPDAWSQLIWRLDNNTFNYAPVEAFFKEFYRPGLLAEIMSGNVPDPPSKPLSEIDIRQPNVRITAVGGAQVPEQRYSLPSVVEEPVTTRDVEVRVDVTDNREPKTREFHPETSGARDLRLFRNGSLVKIWRGDVFGGAVGCNPLEAKTDEPRRAVCSTTVTFTPGRNELSAYAFNHEDVKSRDAVAEVTGADKLKKEGTLYVLVVGVNEYSNEDFNLKYAVTDAEEIGRQVSQHQAPLRKYARTEIIGLTDGTATKENIEEAIRRFSKGASSVTGNTAPGELPEGLSRIRPAEPEDALVIYFAGHGKARCFYDAQKKRTNCDRFYLIPSDGFPKGEAGSKEWQEKMYEASISDEDLERLLEWVDAGKLLMVIDACDSGQALEAEEKRRGPMNSRGLAQLAYEKGMLILTASKTQQAALETERLGHGLLTYSLLEGLTKAEPNEDNSITARNWLDYAVSRVPELEREEFRKRSADIGVASAKKKEREGQSPRVFYRSLANESPLILAKSQ